ncbi:unnamed protein product [Phytophthora fragariaefolia]|uniref:Unnamed protein product n=1 Tax=Phytophthora fragariaefolia TaxID=1490495 RepID=A0A9W6Y7Q5_9STRA|nr:unnamed protein product [Phytophthora fragariaefolia]
MPTRERAQHRRVERSSVTGALTLAVSAPVSGPIAASCSAVERSADAHTQWAASLPWVQGDPSSSSSRSACCARKGAMVDGLIRLTTPRPCPAASPVETTGAGRHDPSATATTRSTPAAPAMKKMSRKNFRAGPLFSSSKASGVAPAGSGSSPGVGGGGILRRATWADKIRDKLPPLGENEYEVLWERGVLGVIFLESERDGIPYVSKATESCISPAVSQGDILKFVNVVRSKDHSFSDFFKILATMKKPVLLRFERVAAGTPSSDEDDAAQLFGVPRSSSANAGQSPASADDADPAGKFTRANSVPQKDQKPPKAMRGAFWRATSAKDSVGGVNPAAQSVGPGTGADRLGSSQVQRRHPSSKDEVSPRDAPGNGGAHASHSPLGPHEYQVYWETGSLGLFFGEDRSTNLPVVTRSTPSANPVVRRAVAINDTLVSANGIRSADYTFEAFFGRLTQMNKPVRLVFRRRLSTDQAVVLKQSEQQQQQQQQQQQRQQQQLQQQLQQRHQQMREQEQKRELQQIHDQELREQQHREQLQREQQHHEQHQREQQQREKQQREKQQREQQEREQQQREQQEREQQQREQQEREQQQREQQEREQQQREQQEREQQQREQQEREQQQREQHQREQQQREKQQREKQQREQQEREQQQREQQEREQQQREQQEREQQQREQQEREQQQREQQEREQQQREQQEREQQQREQHQREQQQREKQQREKQQREQQEREQQQREQQEREQQQREQQEREQQQREQQEREQQQREQQEREQQQREQQEREQQQREQHQREQQQREKQQP